MTIIKEITLIETLGRRFSPLFKSSMNLFNRFPIEEIPKASFQGCYDLNSKIYGFLLFKKRRMFTDNSLNLCLTVDIGDIKMPQRVTCAECNNLLYEGDLLKSPQDIIKKYDGRCPSCNRKLNFDSNGVNITPYNENEE